jgi:type IV pilus assembly protein PilX
MLLMNRADIKKQSGAVLVMALVMLAVLTLIGVASMDSSSMELKIASNKQEHDVAFQTAQAVIALATSTDPDDNPIDYHDISGTTQTLSYPGANSSVTGVTGNASVTLVGCSAGIGDSLEEGKGQKFNFYDVRATGFNTTGSSSSVQVQGVRYFAAGCG